MDNALAFLGIVAGAIVGFLVGRKSGKVLPFGRSDATLIICTPGSGGFVDARIERRMKGREFHWIRVGTKPAAGSRFEMRSKDGTPSVFTPAVPTGVDNVYADVDGAVATGTVYRYSLWQVLADGSEQELHDPEVEVGEMA